MEPRLIKSEVEYDAALAELEALLEANPATGTPESDRLQLLSLIIGKYEEERHPIELPDAIEAITIAMEEQGLSKRDLVPHIGSRARVSEVLARKRPLTLPMIRSLGKALYIPLEVLIQEPFAEEATAAEFKWEHYPYKELIRRGWIPTPADSSADTIKKMLLAFLAPVGNTELMPQRARQDKHLRLGRTVDKYALDSWIAFVLREAQRLQAPKNYNPASMDMNFLRSVAQLSSYSDGPRRAQEYLRAHGISLIVAPHLRGTYLDGAAMLLDERIPVIGITVRHNRLDSFWFTLEHELVHVWKHLRAGTDSYFDDLDVSSGLGAEESQADRLAREALIPDEDWERSAAYFDGTAEAAKHLAEQLGIHPAIVAGRVRFARNNYRLLHNMVGRGEVRRLFPDVSWE